MQTWCASITLQKHTRPPHSSQAFQSSIVILPNAVPATKNLESQQHICSFTRTQASLLRQHGATTDQRRGAPSARGQSSTSQTGRLQCKECCSVRQGSAPSRLAPHRPWRPGKSLNLSRAKQNSCLSRQIVVTVVMDMHLTMVACDAGFHRMFAQILHLESLTVFDLFL